MHKKIKQVVPDIRTIPILNIVRNQDFQIRNRTDPKTVQRYADAMKAGAVFPPVTLAAFDGMKVLVDGWHRVAAVEALGLREIEAKIVPSTRKEAIWLAGQANLTHGLQLKQSEYRHVFRAFVKADKHRRENGSLLSYRDIAKEIGKPHTTIRYWTMKDFPKLFREMSGQEGHEQAGGLHEEEREKPTHADELLAALAEEFQGSVDPEYRGRIIGQLENMVERMKDSGDWNPSQF